MCVTKGGSDRVRETRVLALLEECRRLLACQVVYFVPGCAEPELRHPLLDIVAESSWPVLLRGEITGDGAHLAGLRMEEPVLAACDLAMQRGQLQTLDMNGLLAQRWHLRSVAALPLARPAGTLGVFLLADQHSGHFGAGEERLLYAYLSMHGAQLERELWKLAGETVRASLRKEAHPAGSGQEGLAHEFVSLVGHELRAPLSIIKGYAGLLQAYGGNDEAAPADLTPERRRHYLQVVIEQSDLLELLVNDLLDMARLQRGTLLLRPQAVDISVLCRRVMQLAQWRANQREPGKYQLVCQLPPHLPPALADPTRLQQVLTNVLENAIKYSPRGGHIVLEAGLQEQQEPARVRLVVRDQGLGIPARYLPRLFRPFERLGQAAGPSAQGLGLGLYITHRLVTAMDGTIDIQSCEGHGTDVTITLPALAPGENKRAASQRSEVPFTAFDQAKYTAASKEALYAQGDRPHI